MFTVNVSDGYAAGSAGSRRSINALRDARSRMPLPLGFVTCTSLICPSFMIVNLSSVVPFSGWLLTQRASMRAVSSWRYSGQQNSITFISPPVPPPPNVRPAPCPFAPVSRRHLRAGRHWPRRLRLRLRGRGWLRRRRRRLGRYDVGFVLRCLWNRFRTLGWGSNLFDRAPADARHSRGSRTGRTAQRDRHERS